MTQAIVKRDGWQKWFPWLGCLLFPLVAICILAEGLLGSVRQVWAYTYSETTGTITQSQLKKDDGSHLIDVEYSYEVLGKKYQGNQYCYGAVWTNTGDWNAIQQNLLIGYEVPVYYQSNKPEKAVLVQGLVGFQCSLLWFGLGFVLIGPIAWKMITAHQQGFNPCDKRSIARSADGWEYCPRGRDWWRYYLIGMLAINFAGVFVLCPDHLPVTMYSVAWGILVLVPIVVACRLTAGVAVRADYVNQSWSMFSRQKWITIPVGAMHDINVIQQMNTEATGPEESTDYFRVVIEWYNADAELQQTKLDKWYGVIEALQVAEWLKQEATAIALLI